MVRSEANAQRVFAEILGFPEAVCGLRVTPKVTAPELRRHLEQRYDFKEPVALSASLEDVMELMRDGTLHTTHPRYFGLFNPAVHEAGVLGDALAALYNPQLAVWDHAPAAQEIERHVLKHLTSALGFDTEITVAHFTSGGSEANHTAVLCALAKKFPGVMRHGIRGLPTDPTIYISDQSHHSFQKIARATGLGENALRVIPTDEFQVMDVGALSSQVKLDVLNGKIPSMIVGTAGTTGGGAIDNLPGLRKEATAANCWFHVDAAWAGAAVLSPRVCQLLQGASEADSVTWDAHKWLSVPMGAGMLFCRWPDVLSEVFSVETSYVPSGDSGAKDPYLGTLQWSRRFIGLKVFLTLVTLGASGVREMIEHQLEMANYFRALLSQHGWNIVNRTDLPVVCFTHPRVVSGKVQASDICKQVCERGEAWISTVALRGETLVLRACITNFLTERRDVSILMEQLNNALS